MPYILEDLYYGNLSPSQRAVRPDSKTQKFMQKQSVLETMLSETLTEELRADFEQYLSLSPTFSTPTASTVSLPSSASAPASRTKSSSEPTRPSQI